MFSGNFKSAIASLRISKTRSFLTMLGIIVGICSVVTFVSLGEGLKHQLVGQINNLGSDVLTVRSGKFGSGGNLSLLGFFSTSTLNPGDSTLIKKVPSVTAAAPFDFVTNTVSKDSAALDNIFVIGTTSDLPTVLHQRPLYGDFFAENDDNPDFAVIGNQVAHNLFGELNPVGETFQINGRDFTVRGVMRSQDSGLLSVAETNINSAVFIPIKTALTLTHGNSDILQILAKSAHGKNIDQTARKIQSVLNTAHPGEPISVLKQTELLSAASGLVNTATHFISGIAAISLIVGGIGIMDIMLASVSERTREIGIRKAVGATNRQILYQFLTEGLVLTVGGGIIGIFFSTLIVEFLRLYTTWKPIMSWPILVIAVGFSVLVGLIFSVAPALKAASKNPIEALRS